jgi:amidase
MATVDPPKQALVALPKSEASIEILERHDSFSKEQETLNIIQTAPVPKGTPEFEVLRLKILKDFSDKVPEEYRIAKHYIDAPPRDVTAIPRACGILSEEELEITENYDAVGLANAIATRKYTAVAVAKAFSKRAIICHQISCCLTEWFPDEAEEQARALDEHLERTGKTVGPLHGVPVSIKEHMPIAGHPSSAGFVVTMRIDKKDCHAVAILRSLGAIFYVKTIQPQAIMHLESDCHLGRVLCPYNIKLSAGGSTGGEAALIALRGSCLGVGTDIGGSVRGPAGFCGIYGFKPTSYVFPMKEMMIGGFPAELNVLCSAGPMCNTLRDMDFFMHHILGAKPYLQDPRLVPIPWTGLKTQVPKLKVGVMMDDGMIIPQPPVIRALEWAKSQLSALSFVEIKPFMPHATNEAMRMIRQMYWPDSGLVVKAKLAKTGEPMHSLTAHIMQDAIDDVEKTACEVTAMRVARDDFRCDFAESWSEQDVDVVLCPVFVGPAAAHDTSFYWNYTALFNFVDYPAVTFPTSISALKKGEESYAENRALNDQDEHVRKLWQEGDFEGAPINLQLVARKYHDNFLFGALDLLKDALQLK